jgi:hypothetical protein
MIIFSDHFNFIPSCSRPGSLPGAHTPSRDGPLQLCRTTTAQRDNDRRSMPAQAPIELPNPIAARSLRAWLRQFGIFRSEQSSHPRD